MLIVTYHQTRMTHFFLGLPQTNGEGLVQAEKVRIYPGVNFISDPAVAKALLENEAFKASVAASAAQKASGKPQMGCTYEVVKEDDAKAEEGKPAGKRNPSKKIPDEDIAGLIEACVDIKQLEALAETETRANVQTKITARIAAIRAAKPQDDEE